MAKTTKRQQEFKKRLIQLVHVSYRYREFYRNEKDEYRAKLKHHFGVDSSTKLNIEQLLALVDWLNNKTPELAIIKDRSKDVTDKQLTLIKALWGGYARDKSDTALRNFIYRISKNRYLNLESISKEDATKTILALKNSIGANNDMS